MSDNTDEALSAQKHKDSCAYAVEIAKQFLTFAAGGIAFVVALSQSSSSRHPCILLATFLLLAMSTFFGLLYLMSLVGHIRSHNCYDVFTGKLRSLAITQILAFVAGVLLLGSILLPKPQIPEPQEKGVIVFKVGQREITYSVPPGTAVRLIRKSNSALDIQIGQDKQCRHCDPPCNSP